MLPFRKMSLLPVNTGAKGYFYVAIYTVMDRKNEKGIKAKTLEAIDSTRFQDIATIFLTMYREDNHNYYIKTVLKS